jgi:glyoxylase-like metal-dependent hydrolase (beta-lactamase superfamily II)
MPSCFERVRDGDQIAFGGRKWRVITAGGHAAEHASFYCEEESILIAGDQILPTISPMIGVWSEQPDANPLAEYLASLARFEKLLPPDTLVLPGHGLPFTGLHLRLDQLVEHHGQRLAYLEQQMGAAGTGMELAGALFKKAVNEGHARLALAETVAHLNLLIAQGRAERLEHHDGVWRYQRAQAVTHKSKPARAGKAKVAARAR